MNHPNALCRCESCLEKQRQNQFHYTPEIQGDVKEFFKSFDIETMTESLKLIFNMALYDSDQDLEQVHKQAFHQVNLLREGLEGLGKS